MSNIQIIAKKLNETTLAVLGNESIEGFERAYNIANAIGVLSELLTPEYMKPIMALQGNKLGFLTDKDKSGGYPEATVKKCLIEAVLSGLQPCGNHFNIIAGNMYPTKEGCGYRLNNFPGLRYELVCGLPNINSTRTSAAVDVHIKWTINGETKDKTIPIPIKIDQYASVDSIIGKATRKGRAWLLSTITGIEVTDGEVTDAVVIKEVDKEAERVEKMIQAATTEAELDNLRPFLKEGQQDLFDQKAIEILSK